jgi:hypothetical protein
MDPIAFGNYAHLWYQLIDDEQFLHAIRSMFKRDEMQIPLEYTTRCKLCGNEVDVTHHELSCNKMGGYKTKQHDITVKSMIP